MKIVFVTDLYFPSIGGVEIETRRMTTKLSENGHDVWIIAPSDGKFQKCQREGLVNIVRIKPHLKPITPLFLVKKTIFTELKKINPEIIHLQTTLTFSKAASLYAKRFNVACIATGHYADGELEYSFKNKKLMAGIAKYLIDAYCKLVWKNVNYVTVPSEFANKRNLKLVGDSSKIITVSNGIEIGDFIKSRKHRQRKTILYVGRFEASKNVEAIIEAMPAILAKTKATLYLVGGGTKEKELKSLVSGMGLEGKVVFLGFLEASKIKQIYRKTDVFVTASGADNQPLAILEAMASGLPIVASKVGGIPELVENGVNGYLFNSDDSQSLARSVVRILSDEKLMTRLGRSSLDKIKKHDINEVVVKMQSLYQKAISINSLRISREKVTPFYLSKEFFLRIAVAGLVLSILFRNVLASPSKVSAGELVIKNKIMNSKIVKKIENLDLKLKTTTFKKVTSKSI